MHSTKDNDGHLKWTISMQIAKEKMISTEEEEESKCCCMTTHLLFVVVVSEGGIYIYFFKLRFVVKIKNFRNFAHFRNLI